MSNTNAVPIQPTYYGFLYTTYDALLLLEASLQGSLHHIPRRPHDRERQDLIKSGNIFVYEEGSSGIKRWTDGSSWSPSRIMANFLIYRELEAPFPPGEKKRAKKPQKKAGEQSSSVLPGYGESSQSYPKTQITAGSWTMPNGQTADRADVERNLYGSLVDSYNFKEDGLMKKTFSCKLNGILHHVVSYYKPIDVINNVLKRPTHDDRLMNVVPRVQMFLDQSYRANVEEAEIPEHLQDHFAPFIQRFPPGGPMVPNGYGAPQSHAPALTGYARSDRGSIGHIDTTGMWIPAPATSSYGGWMEHGSYGGSDSGFPHQAAMSYSGHSITPSQSNLQSFTSSAPSLPSSSSFDTTLSPHSGYGSQQPQTEGSYQPHTAHYTASHPSYAHQESLAAHQGFVNQQAYAPAPHLSFETPGQQNTNHFGYGSSGNSFHLSQSTPRYMSSEEHEQMRRRHSSFLPEHAGDLAPMDMNIQEGQTQTQN